MRTKATISAAKKVNFTMLSSFNVAMVVDPYRPSALIGSLNMRVFETWMATGSELFSLLTCLHNNHIYIAKCLFSIRDD